MKKVDIIIPVHNRWDHTIQTLESLLANTDGKLFNLYIVNDKSDPEVGHNLAKFVASANLDFVHLQSNSENIGPGASRNKITRMITEQGGRSKYLYHSDNDVYFQRGWLETLIVLYEEKGHEIKVIGGGCHPYLQTSERFQSNVVWGYAIGKKDAVSGYSQFMSWDVWDKYGPFDESMRNAERKIMGSEDWAFCQKIVKDGFMVGSIEPELVIATGKTNTYGDLATGHETFKQSEGVQII